VGASNHYKGFENAPKNKPLIFVSNHQSMFDIPPIIWGFREFHPKFVSKKELGKGVPSISMNLRLNNSALIDRKDPKQSIEAVEKLGRHIEKENYSACIFPEGTRGRNGKVKNFKVGGLEALLRGSPSALIIPIAINGTSKLISKGYFPLTLGCKLNYTALSAIDPKGRNIIELTEDIRQQIIKEVEA
jgi:1-acyl-sn-glycerol-3-phosphate acyltransferase